MPNKIFLYFDNGVAVCSDFEDGCPHPHFCVEYNDERPAIFDGGGAPVVQLEDAD